MTKFIKPFMVAMIAIILSSCGVRYHEAVKMYDPVNLSLVKIGMTKAEVETALAKKPDNIVAAEHYPDANTLIEVVQYSQWGTIGEGTNAVSKKTDSYWLYFVNDKLDRWHQIRPEDKRPMDYRGGAGH